MTKEAGRVWPETAEALMRSRFEAFRDGDAQNPRWRGLQIIDTVAGTAADDTGIVEFRATYFHQRDLQVLHERSRFVREAGRWYYLDAVGTVL